MPDKKRRERLFLLLCLAVAGVKTPKLIEEPVRTTSIWNQSKPQLALKQPECQLESVALPTLVSTAFITLFQGSDEAQDRAHCSPTH